MVGTSYLTIYTANGNIFLRVIITFVHTIEMNCIMHKVIKSVSFTLLMII